MATYELDVSSVPVNVSEIMDGTTRIVELGHTYTVQVTTHDAAVRLAFSDDSPEGYDAHVLEPMKMYCITATGENPWLWTGMGQMAKVAWTEGSAVAQQAFGDRGPPVDVQDWDATRTYTNHDGFIARAATDGTILYTTLTGSSEQTDTVTAGDMIGGLGHIPVQLRQVNQTSTATLVIGTFAR